MFAVGIAGRKWRRLLRQRRLLLLRQRRRQQRLWQRRRAMRGRSADDRRIFPSVRVGARIAIVVVLALGARAYAHLILGGSLDDLGKQLVLLKYENYDYLSCKKR